MAAIEKVGIFGRESFFGLLPFRDFAVQLLGPSTRRQGPAGDNRLPLEQRTGCGRPMHGPAGGFGGDWFGCYAHGNNCMSETSDSMIGQSTAAEPSRATASSCAATGLLQNVYNDDLEAVFKAKDMGGALRKLASWSRSSRLCREARPARFMAA